MTHQLLDPSIDNVISAMHVAWDADAWELARSLLEQYVPYPENRCMRCGWRAVWRVLPAGSFTESLYAYRLCGRCTRVALPCGWEFRYTYPVSGS